MVENSDQIRDRIDAQRDELGENLNEIERRFRTATDWRSHVENRPWLAMGVALGAGFALGSLLFRRDSDSYDYSSYDDDSSSKAYAGASAYSAYSSGSGSSYSGSTPGAYSSGSSTGGYSSGSSTGDYSSGSSYGETSTSRSPKMPVFRQQAKRFTDNIDAVMASLLSVGQAKLQEVLNEAIPGFNDHYERAARERGLYDSGSQQGMGSEQGTGTSSYTDRDTQYQAGNQNESGFGAGESTNYAGNTGASTMGSTTQQQPTNTF